MSFKKNFLFYFSFQGNELAVGNIEGTLSVYKGKEFSPWKKCSDLGMVNTSEFLPSLSSL